jgi:hypothetical protein
VLVSNRCCGSPCITSLLPVVLQGWVVCSVQVIFAVTTNGDRPAIPAVDALVEELSGLADSSIREYQQQYAGGKNTSQ